MNVELKTRVAALVMAASFTVWGPAAAQTSSMGPVPVPKFTGPIAETTESHPWLGAKHLMNPIDLAASGYVEEEFIISGNANVYDWKPDGSMKVRASDLPYATRIFVRRPSDANRFSGTVVVEGGNNMPGQGWEVNSLWSNLNEYVRDRGHVWVSVTIFPGTAAALKQFDPKRYAAVSFPPSVCPAAGQGPPPARPEADREGGVVWDILSQAGALMKSPSGPLPGFKVGYVYMMMQSGGHIPTYISGFHRIAKLADGRPVYDGYIQKESGSATATSRCVPGPAFDDPRAVPRNIGVPVIHAEAQSYVVSDPDRRLAGRREDSDAPQDRYRLYEIAGASHLDRQPYRFIPVVADQMRTKGNASPVSTLWPWNYTCGEPLRPMNPFPNYYILAGALENLDRWVREGVPPPRAERIAIDNPGTPRAAARFDRHGNVIGGVRSPWVDVPIATYKAGSGPSQCPVMSAAIEFDWAKREALYSTSENYRSRFLKALDQWEKDRWVTASDAAKIRAELAPTSTASRR